MAPVDASVIKPRCCVVITATSGIQSWQTRANPFGYYRFDVPAATYEIRPEVIKHPEHLGFIFQPESQTTSGGFLVFDYSNYSICSCPV